MAKLAFYADAHLANHRVLGGDVDCSINTRAEQILSVLMDVDDVAMGEGATMFVLGDLFDHTRPEPQLIHRVQLTLSAPTFLLPGNHDMVSLDREDNALVPLGGFGEVVVVDAPWVTGADLGSVMCLPYHPEMSKDFLVNHLLGMGKPLALAMHVGISDDDTPAYLRDKPNVIHVRDLVEACRDNGVKYVFAGDWHQARRWDIDGVTVVQCGALVPNGFRDDGLKGYGRVWLLDTEADDVDYVEIAGPRFLTYGSDELDRLRADVAAEDVVAEEDRALNLLYVRVKAKPGSETEAYGLLTELEQHRHICRWEVVPDWRGVELDLKAAAARARSAPTQDEAIRAYLAGMHLEPGVTTRAVADRLARLRKEADQ